MNPDPDRLIGLWRTDPSDTRSVREFGDVSLEFTEDGKLQYTIHLQAKRQIFRLSYRVEGDILVTDQESSPREDRVAFFFDGDNRLVIKSVDPRPSSTYLRVHA